MKAWFCSDEECGVVVWADTRGKARYRATFELGHDLDFGGFAQIIYAHRAPLLDGEPKDMVTAGEFVRAGGWEECKSCGTPVRQDQKFIEIDTAYVRHAECPED